MADAVKISVGCQAAFSGGSTRMTISTSQDYGAMCIKGTTFVSIGAWNALDKGEIVTIKLLYLRNLSDNNMSVSFDAGVTTEFALPSGQATLIPITLSLTDVYVTADAGITQTLMYMLIGD